MSTGAPMSEEDLNTAAVRIDSRKRDGCMDISLRNTADRLLSEVNLLRAANAALAERVAALESVVHGQRIDISHRSRVCETLQRQLELAGLVTLATPPGPAGGEGGGG